MKVPPSLIFGLASQQERKACGGSAAKGSSGSVLAECKSDRTPVVARVESMGAGRRRQASGTRPGRRGTRSYSRPRAAEGRAGVRSLVAARRSLRSRVGFCLIAGERPCTIGCGAWQYDTREALRDGWNDGTTLERRQAPPCCLGERGGPCFADALAGVPFLFSPVKLRTRRRGAWRRLTRGRLATLGREGGGARGRSDEEGKMRRGEK